MIALIQRVSQARVDVDAQTVGAIDAGLLALIGVQPDDGEAQDAGTARQDDARPLEPPPEPTARRAP